jgi:dihydropteroate synthase
MGTVLAPVDLGPFRWDWSRTCVFGVVNVTPDSFSDGGQWFDPAAAVGHALRLAEDGADVLDIGGESTRPGSEPVEAEEELRRVMPVIEGLAGRVQCAISIDTYKARVAREAVSAGASVINDVSGAALDCEILQAAAETGATVVLGHLRGRPATMHRDIAFTDVVGEVADELRARVRAAVRAGVGPEKLWVAPGLGFGKTAQQSMTLLQSTGSLREQLGYPVLVGPSRKSFIGKVTGEPVEDRLIGTCAAVTAAIARGADAVRVHDVAALKPAVRLADAIRRSTAT